MIMLMMIFVINSKDINQDIQINEVIQDNILQFDYKVYRLKVNRNDDLKNKALALNLFSEQNNLKVYLDCDIQPTFLDYYLWQSTQSQQIQINVSQDQRNSFNCSDNLFFIAVFSDFFSNYQFIVQVFDGIHSLQYNQPFNGQLKPQEIIQFKLQPIQQYEEIKIEINIEKAQKFIKKCIQEDCLITKFDYQDTLDKYFIGKDSYKLINQFCDNCFYLIGLQSDYKQFYRIIQLQNHSHFLLKEGHYDQFKVDQGSSIYYSYNISNITSIKKSKFQLTQLNGQCRLYGSSQNRYPNLTNYEATDELQITISNHNVYYLTVFGISFCNYSLQTTVERDQNINLTKFIKLQNGVQIQHQQLELYSFFLISLEIQASFSITLSNIVGDFIMYVKSNTSDNEIPDSNSFQWKDPKQVYIKIDDKNQASSYYIGVQCLNLQGEFLIQYNIHFEIKFYQIGTQIIDSVNKNQTNYYKLPMIERDLIFIREIYNGNLQSDLKIYISLSQTNKIPNEKYNDYVFLNTQLTIPQQELICNSVQKQKRSQCLIYLSVTSVNGPIFYTITTKNLNNNIQLHEGKSQTLSFKQDALFYYYLNQNGVSIQWYSQNGSEAQIIPYLCYMNKSMVNIQEYSPFKQKNNHPIQTIIVSQSHEQFILYIQVQPFAKHIEDDVYQIGVYETLKVLKIEERIRDYVQKGKTKFFTLTLDEDVKSLILNVQVLGNQNQLSLSVQQGENSRPTLQTESLQLSIRIDSFYIYQNFHYRQFSQDQYVIGVQGQDDCEFQISYQLRDVSYQFIPNESLPLKLLEVNIPAIYALIEKESFKLILAVLDGAIQIRIKHFQDNINSLDLDDNLIVEDIATEFKSYQIDACQFENCQYLIEIIDMEQTSQGAIKIQKNQQLNQLVDNLAQYEILEQFQKIEYTYFSQNQFQIQFHYVFGQIEVEIAEQSYSLDNSNNIQKFVINNNTNIDFIRTTNTVEQFVIRVKCLTPKAYFEITMKRNNKQFTTLKIGQIIDQQLLRQEQSILHYQSLTNTINNQNTTKYLSLQIVGVFQSIDLFDFQIKHSTIDKIVKFKKQYQRGIFFKLYDVFGIYDLIITPKQKSSYVKILLSDDEMNLMMNGIPQYQLARVGQPNYYQIKLLESSALFLEVLVCKGTILIQGTSNPSHLNKQIFEIQLMTKPQEYFNTILQLERGTYYFMVKLISSEVKGENQVRMTNYYIRHQTYKRIDPIPNNNFQFKNLNLNWEIINNELILEIPNLIYDNQSQQLKQLQIYFIIQTYKQDDIVCFYEAYTIDKNDETQFIKVVNQSLQKNSTQVNLGFQNQPIIYINIVGKVEIYYNLEIQELSFPFPIKELNIGDITTQEDNYWYIYLILFIIFLIILIIILFYKRRKNQSLSNQSENLNIEMNYQEFILK